MNKHRGLLLNADIEYEKMKDPSIRREEMMLCLKSVHDQMLANLKRHPNRWSKENWRFTQERKIDKKNTSIEKQVEKLIVNNGDSNQWANQVPVASGLVDEKSDKKRSIDLVCRICNREYDFIELKIESNNPYYAASEILCYGLLYVLHRRCRCYMARWKPEDKKLLEAETIHLKVLAPCGFFKGKEKLKQYEKCVSTVIGEYVKNQVDGLSMDFCFEYFNSEHLSSEDIANAILSADGRKPL